MACRRAVPQLVADGGVSAQRADCRACSLAHRLASRRPNASSGTHRRQAIVFHRLPGRCRMSSGGLKIALVDPSLFTIPYDAKLADALRGLRHEVTVYGEAREPGDEPVELAQLRPLFYPEMRHLGTRRWPRPVLRLAKGTLHWRAMRRLVGDLRTVGPDIIHFQWSPLPVVDRLFLGDLRRLAPVVLTAHDSQPFNGDAWRLQKWGATNILSEF